MAREARLPLSQLADFAERLLREGDLSGALLGVFNDVQIEHVRQSIAARRFVATLVHFGHHSDAGLRFLLKAMPHVPQAQQVRCVRYAWTTGQYGENRIGSMSTDKAKRSRGLWLDLFRQVSALRQTVRRLDLPPTVTVYRGVAAKDHREARRRMLEIGWTLRRDVAAWFARRWRVSDLHVYGRSRDGFIGRATIHRTRILSYFHDGEAEVIVDPAEVRSVVVEPLWADDKRAADKYQRRLDRERQRKR